MSVSSVPVDDQGGGELQETSAAEVDDVEQPFEVEGEVVAEDQDVSSSTIPGLFDDDDFNIDEIVNEELEAGAVSTDPAKLLIFTHSWLLNIDTWCADDNVDEVLAQIGFKSFVRQTEGMEQNEERMFEYPEPPDRSIKFGALLKKCGYAEDVLEQYADAADIEVRLCNIPAASKECHVIRQVARTLSLSLSQTHTHPHTHTCMFSDYWDPDRLQESRGRESLCVH